MMQQRQQPRSAAPGSNSGNEATLQTSIAHDPPTPTAPTRIAVQSALPGFTAHVTDSKCQAVGAWGEQWAAAALSRNGYQVSFTRQQSAGDLRVCDPSTGEIFAVEVKTARRSKSGRATAFQFCLYRARATGKVCTDAARADVVILLAVHESARVTAFVIPAAILAGSKKIAITHPDGPTKWADYRQAGRLIALP